MIEGTDDTAQGDPARTTVIACDESGSEGDRVFDSANRVFTHAGVHLSTEQARGILTELRGRLRAQSGELKARHLLRGLYARDARHWLFGEGGPLAGHTTVWVLDKEFFLTSKIIDLLIEPIVHESGVDLYGNRRARQIAYDFHSRGPRSFGFGGFLQHRL